MPDLGRDYAMKNKTKLIVAGVILLGGLPFVFYRPESTSWNPPADCKPVWAECDTYREAGGYVRLGFRAYQCPDGFVAPAVTGKNGEALFNIVGACMATEGKEGDSTEASRVDFSCVMPYPGAETECLRKVPKRTGADGKTREAHMRFAMAGEYFPTSESAGRCMPSPCVLLAGIPFK